MTDTVPIPEIERRLLSAEEVAQLLGQSVRWVYRHTGGGLRIPGVRLGKKWKFRQASVMAWLEEQERRAC